MDPVEHCGLGGHLGGLLDPREDRPHAAHLVDVLHGQVGVQVLPRSCILFPEVAAPVQHLFGHKVDGQGPPLPDLQRIPVLCQRVLAARVQVWPCAGLRLLLFQVRGLRAGRHWRLRHQAVGGEPEAHEPQLLPALPSRECGGPDEPVHGLRHHGDCVAGPALPLCFRRAGCDVQGSRARLQECLRVPGRAADLAGLLEQGPQAASRCAPCHLRPLRSPEAAH
mmetsp:Transcript_41420/g.131736  ORF Transcript_41420/g.131736 Transcript_41420/m.131736 type:complete len:223 (+) Transcript_41420:324-992(+)